MVPDPASRIQPKVFGSLRTASIQLAMAPSNFDRRLVAILEV
jgi:hypothetical protein